MVEELKDFENQVKSSDLVLLDFYADWCGPCKQLTPHLEALEKSMQDLKIYKVDVDKSINFASVNQVRAMPTLILFKNGQEIGRKVGFAPKADLEKWILDSSSQSKL